MGSVKPEEADVPQVEVARAPPMEVGMDTSTQLHRKNCTVVQSWFAQEVQLEADSLEVPTAAVALAEEPKAEQAAEEEATATEVANSVAAAAVLARAEVAEAAHSVAPETLEKDSAARKLALAVAASAEEVDLARAVEDAEGADLVVEDEEEVDLDLAAVVPCAAHSWPHLTCSR